MTSFFLHRLNLDHASHIRCTAFDKRFSSFVSDPNIIIHVKRIAAGAIIAMNTSSDADGKISHAFPVAIAFLPFIFKSKLRISVPCISICILYQMRQKNTEVDCYSNLSMQFDNISFTTHHILIVESTYGPSNT